MGKPGNYKMLDYISYSAPGRAVAGINNPWDAYAALMGIGGNDPGSAEARARILEERKSVLDLVAGRIERLRRLPLGQADRQKLDMHFTAVREVELEASATGVSCSDTGLEPRARAPRDTVAQHDRRRETRRQNQRYRDDDESPERQHASMIRSETAD